MKQLYFIIVLLLVSGVSRAQTICDSCCAESFPYTFCSLLGNSQFTQCSSNPNADGNPVKSFIPSCVIVDPMRPDALWQPKGPPPTPASLLSNDALDNDTDKESGASTQFDADQTLFLQIPPQPPSPPTDPGETPPENTCGDDPYPLGLSVPSRESIFERYVDDDIDPTEGWIVPPWHHNFDHDEGYWEGDEDAYDAACNQFSLDSENFLNGDPPDKIDTSDLDVFTRGIVDWYSIEDGILLNDELTHDEDSVGDDESTETAWETCESNYSADSAAWPARYAQYQGTALQYTADSIAWVANVNSYTLVFDTTQAQADARLALTGWLNLCSPPIQPCETSPACCLHVVMDDNFRDFIKNPTGTLAQTLTPNDTEILPCRGGTCPSRIIEVNITDEFIAANRQADADSGSSPSQYTLHPVSRTEFFTGLTPPDTVATGYSAFSFYQLMEHEIGHYLGLNHPEDTDGLGHTCHNCFTANPFGPTNVTGYRAVMGLNTIIPNPGFNAPVSLTSEDECQFQKLYCNACGGGSGAAPCAYDAGVISPEDGEFNAEIYPNPTTGSCQLQLEVPERELVQVAIYDVLGNQVRMVSSGYEEEGQQSISLGTETLPSGNYVCRVRVGDRVSYINLAITK